MDLANIQISVSSSYCRPPKFIYSTLNVHYVKDWCGSFVIVAEVKCRRQCDPLRHKEKNPNYGERNYHYASSDQHPVKWAPKFVRKECS